MPQVLLTNGSSVEIRAQEPWPNDVKLFQPFEVEQVLLPDNTACLAVKAFLKMCNLPYTIEMRGNAEHMSPSNHVPFIKAGAFIIAELDPIITFVGNKVRLILNCSVYQAGVSLTENLDTTQRSDMRAYMSLVNNVLANSELYISWLDNKTYEVTKSRYGSVHPWPLNKILTYQKYCQVIRKLKVLGWKHKKLEEVYKEVDNCCNALSERLGNQSYFFGNTPTELDALVFGHLYTLLTTPLPDSHLASIIRNYNNLVKLCQEIDTEYFKHFQVTSSDSRNGSNGVSSSNGNGEFDKLEDISQL